MSASEPAPSPTIVFFARGVIARLAAWPALRLAVANSWGGPSASEKRTWLAGALVEQFTDASPSQIPDAGYVEEMLLQVMEDEFDVMLEDGSAEGVARDVVRLWSEVQAGTAQETVSRWEAEADRVKGKAVQVEEGAGSGSDWEDEESESDSTMEEDEAPPLLDRAAGSSVEKRKEEPLVDDDGFTLVQGKGKGKR